MAKSTQPHSMRKALYDEEILARMNQNQRREAWDLETSIAWNTTIDLTKPLVPLDEDAILFPGANSEQRLAISQMMGLIIAGSICEMEECLLRLRKECWEDVHRRTPVAPEFVELGDLFFEEELKHSSAFRRYMEKYAATAGLDLDDLRQLLPRVQGTRSEDILRHNVKKGGQSFWWIVAQVEQEFLLLYHAFRPFRFQMEPLYYQIHEKHFEEEARHAPFPYLMLELMCQRNPQLMNLVHVKVDYAVAQVVQTLWTITNLNNLKKLKAMAHKHPLYEVLNSALPLFEKIPSTRAIWKMVTSAPYVSSLVNPTTHHRILRFAKDQGSLILPFPMYKNTKLVKY